MSYSTLPLASKLFQLTFLTCALALAGCGGGDTVDVITPAPGTGGNTGGGNGQPPVPVESLNIKESGLVNVDGNPVTTVSLDGAYYEVKVTDAKGQPVSNAKVSFAVDADGIALSQTTSGSMLTDSEGKARIFLKPNSPEVLGAYTISATASFNGNTATNEITFSVQATNVALSALIVKEAQLPSGGQTALSLKVTDTNGKALSGVLVNLNASCGQIPAQMSSDSDGMVEVVYKAINPDDTLCSGSVNISASSGRAVQSTRVNVQLPEATSIVYTSNPLTLGIQNSGSSATGSVEFTVYSNNTPLANANVSLSLEKSPLGLTFGVLGNRNLIPATTDANGKVSVNIYPGSTPGPVEIKATLVRDSRINALSKDISIASSRVTQDGLSISMEKNALDWGLDGDQSKVFARMVDRNGNAVPNGTVINFTAGGGKVSPASCSTMNGVCEVIFSTQNPRPGSGRVSILAVAEGEKSYIDMNQNNAWDKGIDVLVHNIGDTFRDDNEDGVFQLGEFTYPLTTQANQVCENNIKQFIQLKFPTASQIQKNDFENNYIAKYVSPNKPMSCNSDLDTVVRYQVTQLISEGKKANFALVDSNGGQIIPQSIKTTDSEVRVRINSDGFLGLNPMPSGTTISGTIIPRQSPVITISKGSTLKAYEIKITNLNKLQEYTFTVAGNEYSKETDANGVLTKSIELEKKPEVSDIVLKQSQGECRATLETAPKVPNNVSTGIPGMNVGTISRFSIENCQAGDKFKITATSPNNNVSSEIFNIR
ncbi:hypothetical protein [Psychrobacter sp. 16-MNA-CIBAN-0192]|uniref:Ig-like domain-containing protein n=1 Tax=Psychrobacter sp. 16-MNA-CIBAN-0192 TaxID=3140448 RepID=UPI00333356A9